MLGDREKSFFIHTAMGASEFSGCERKQGALLVRDTRILSYGFNRRVVKDKKWEVSAAYDAIFGSRQEDLSGTAIFLSYFPEVDDLKLIVATGIKSIYFNGKIDDAKAVEFMNNLTEEIGRAHV